MKKIYFILLFCALSIQTYAQTNRFKQAVFTDAQIKVDSNIVYGSALNFSPAVMVPLRMDIYHADPSVDTLKNRPVIILFHSGSFLPASINASSPSNGGAFLGTRRDSAVIEMCRQFAKRGWVAIAATHRLGWVANSPSSNTQKITIMRAVYRATQDGRTLMRYMRRSVDSMSNVYHIDGNKIVIGGSSSGAYVALHANSLDRGSDILAPNLLDSIGNSVIDTIALGGFNAGNYPGYNSRPNLVLSLGGAIADTSIMSNLDAPIIAFHGVKDPTTPFNRGIVKNAGTLAPITTVDGSNSFILTANHLGINAPIIAAGYGGTKAGLFPFVGAGFEPYGWYNKSPIFAPTNARPRALLYIDTIMNTFSPIAISVLNLNTNQPSNIKAIENIGLSMYPNPAKDILNITATRANIESVSLIDITGKIILNNLINNNQGELNIAAISKGIYTVLIQTSTGSVFQKLIIE
ncbi:MAG: T9SS type A sorting domain-containing protein [bacterium]|nr:T9SS type A sorting domain-containing protein [bacterium]